MSDDRIKMLSAMFAALEKLVVRKLLDIETRVEKLEAIAAAPNAPASEIANNRLNAHIADRPK